MENIISITMINPKRKPLFVRCLEKIFYFRLKASMRTHRHKTRCATTPIPMSLRYGLFFPAFRLFFLEEIYLRYTLILTVRVKENVFVTLTYTLT